MIDNMLFFLYLEPRFMTLMHKLLSLGFVIKESIESYGDHNELRIYFPSEKLKLAETYRKETYPMTSYFPGEVGSLINLKYNSDLVDYFNWDFDNEDVVVEGESDKFLPYLALYVTDDPEPWIIVHKCDYEDCGIIQGRKHYQMNQMEDFYRDLYGRVGLYEYNSELESYREIIFLLENKINSEEIDPVNREYLDTQITRLYNALPKSQ